MTMPVPSQGVWKESTFETFDRLKLFYRFYEKPGAKDLLLIVHGHGEHSGRYLKFASYLNGLDLSIAVWDLRGNGRSGGPEVYVNRFDDYLKDLSCFFEFLKKQNRVPGRVVLLGHSLGGLTAILWALRHEQEMKALILSSPFLGIRFPSFLIHANRFLNRWVPKFCYQNPVYPPHLTHSPEEAGIYRKDPWIKRKMSVRLFEEMVQAACRVHERSETRFSVPVFILAAELEKIVDLEATRKFFGKLEAPAKELEIFPGFYHEIFNEAGQEKVFGSLRKALLKIGVSTRPESR